MTPLFVVIMIIGILEILAASSLLLGTVYNKPNFLVPMLILFPVELALWISIIGIYCIYIGIVFLVILSLLYVYFWICIFSYWKQMKEVLGNAFGKWETPGVVHEAPVDQETTAVQEATAGLETNKKTPDDQETIVHLYDAMLPCLMIYIVLIYL